MSYAKVQKIVHTDLIVCLIYCRSNLDDERFDNTIGALEDIIMGMKSLLVHLLYFSCVKNLPNSSLPLLILYLLGQCQMGGKLSFSTAQSLI